MIDNTSRHYDALKTRLEAIIGILEDHIDLSCSSTSPFFCLCQKCCLALQRLIISDSDCSIPPVNIPQTVMSGLPGRPKIHVSLEFVELLREADYAWSQVATVIGVSRTTLWRRIKETNTFPNKYSPISDQALK